MSNGYYPLIELTRGGIIESIHYGAFSVVDSHGNLLAGLGDPELITFPRSSEKPFQALPLLEINGDSHFGLTEEEIAILCASHTGSDIHVNVVNSLQRKTGVHESELLCGIHPPYDRAAQENLEKSHRRPTPNRNNCSGKHTGMLALAKLHHFPLENYIHPEHPLQQLILSSISEMFNVDKRRIIIGIDGCSAPNFAVPLNIFAAAFARLVDPIDLPPTRAEACYRITHAMTLHPEMISGPNRLDTILMQLGKGKIVAKAGAEGYQAIGLARGVLGKDSPAIGIALKIAGGDHADYQTAMHRQFDGDEPFDLSSNDMIDRARPCAVIELLRQLGALDEVSLGLLKHYSARPLYNWRKIEVGEIRAVFNITL